MEEKKINGKSEENPKYTLIWIVAGVLAVLAICFIYFIRDAHLAQIERMVVKEVSYKTVMIEKSMEAAQSKLQSIALDASRKLRTPSVSKMVSKLSSYQYSSTFDYLNFIGSDGILVDSLEEGDFSNESFFRKGMMGKTGKRETYKSQREQQTYVSFYTPVLYRDSIVGLLNGYVGGRTKLRSMLDSTINGHAVAEVILDSKFNVIVSSKSDVDFGLPLSSVLTGNFVEQNVEKFHKNALQNSIPVFYCNGGEGTFMAAVDQIGNTGWYMAVMVAPRSLANISYMVVFATALIAIFILVVVCVVVYFMNRANRKVRSESEGHLHNVMLALAETYGNVFEIDSETGESHVIRIAPILVQKAGRLFSEDSKYNQIMAVYSNRMVIPEDAILFEPVLTLDKVNETLARKSQFDFVFRTYDGVEGFHYIQALFVKPSKTRPEFVMGFKNVDDTMEAELAKRKKLGEQRLALEAALEKAQSADKAKSKFLFNMSHDIRTPMNAVLGYDTLALQYMWELGLPPEQTEKLARCLNNIQLSGKQLLGLINSVLNMARIESGEISLDESPTVVAELTNEVAVTFEETAREKNIMLLVSRNLKHKCIVCDKVKMQQVILNVVSNSVKYTKPAGTVRVNIKETAHEQEGWCNIVTTVEDNGIGISENFLPHIFEDFERERSATVSGVIGSGLGLSIVKKYVDLMGGKIEITSHEGSGTKVVVVTPHRIAEGEEASSETIPMQHSEKLQGKRILLVEDNKMNREIAEEMLVSFGVSVECACDGVEALDKISIEPAGAFDLVLMDVQMPRMDGYEATRAIRELSDPLKANIQIYAMTANAFEEDVQESRNAGMNGHISKPVDFAKFFNLLTKVFA